MPPNSRSWRLATCGLVALLFVVLGGCHGRIVVAKDTERSRAETLAWSQVVISHGQPGDWLLVRGYHKVDQLVAIVSNARFSHVAVLDLARQEVVEAVAPVVRSQALISFLQGAHRVVLIRPKGWTPARGLEAVARARRKIGVSYDFLGTVGLPSKGRLYCSELAAWSMGLSVDERGLHRVLVPKDMGRYGTVVFDSGERSGR